MPAPGRNGSAGCEPLRWSRTVPCRAGTPLPPVPECGVPAMFQGKDIAMTTDKKNQALPQHSPFKTVLLHGARFRAGPALPDQPYTHDILVDMDGGGHVASVMGFDSYGETSAQTEEHVAVLTASAQMLTALVDMLNARGRGYALPWEAVEQAVFAGFGTPALGTGFQLVLGGQFATMRGPLHVGIAGTTWHVTGHGYDAARRVVMLLTSETEVEIAISLDELRLSFRPEEGRKE